MPILYSDNQFLSLSFGLYFFIFNLRTFPSTSCDDVKTKINDQVTAWSGPSGCDNGGEKCLYEKVSEDATTIKLKHTTPVHKYVDDISFTFTAQGTGCEVQGYSRSEIWFAHLDKATNYCNMHNLLTAVTLTRGFGGED